jgi:hypothetical protein
MSAHDDGLYKNFYAIYATDAERIAAETELLYSVLDEERAAMAEKGGASEEVLPDDDDEDDRANAHDGIAFKDPDFVAGGSSLYLNPFQPPRGSMPADMMEWNRLSKREVDGMTSFALFGPGVPGVDEEPTSLVIQGALKNCWFVGACAILSTKPELVKALFVSDQDQFGSKGFYTVRFFKQGLARYVHIDDRVPCNRAGRVTYARTVEPNEGWLMLVEKAYAKLHGCYQNLVYGQVERGLRDLTGWPTFKHALVDEDGELWETLKKYLTYPGWLMGVEFREKGTPGHGLLAGHAYAVLDMVEAHSDATAQYDQLDVRMVKLHNPWGMTTWNGPWSQNSGLWAQYPEIHRQLREPDNNDKSRRRKKGKARTEFEMTADAAADAIFASKQAATCWMSWEDLLDHFTIATVAVQVRPAEGGKVKGEPGGSNFRFRGRWIPGDSKTGAGGSPEHVSWPQNPQYAFEVPASGATIAITLSTTDTRFQTLDLSAANGVDSGPRDQCIGFVVMALSGSKLRSTKFHPLKMKAKSPGYSQTQSVSGLATLRAGRYAIVPSTFDPEADPLNFVLEMSSSVTVTMAQSGDELPDADELDESDDEELGVIDNMGVEQGFSSLSYFCFVCCVCLTFCMCMFYKNNLVAGDVTDPENSGKELEALSAQAGELAHFIKSLITDIKTLEDRVSVLMPPNFSNE